MKQHPQLCFHSSKEVLKGESLMVKAKGQGRFHSSKEVLKELMAAANIQVVSGFHSSKEVLKVLLWLCLDGKSLVSIPLRKF